MFNQKGFTLLESMVVVSLIAIVTTIGVPAYFKMVGKYRVNTQMQTLFLSVQTARQDAIFSNSFVSICPGKSGVCSKNWSDGHLIFRDANRNGMREENEKIVQELQPAQGNAKVSWKAFQNKSTLSFLGSGMTAHQNGSFIICHSDYPEFSRAVIVTKLGRPRYSTDRNGDGIEEDATGKNISCK